MSESECCPIGGYSYNGETDEDLLEEGDTCGADDELCTSCNESAICEARDYR